MSFAILRRYIYQLSNTLGEQGRKLTRDARSLYLLTKEAWKLDRPKASLILINQILGSVSRYAVTMLDASLLTLSLLILQRDESFSKSRFEWLVLLRICLMAFNYERAHYTADIKKALRVTLGEKRVLKLVAKYLQLPYLQQQKESTQSRFKDVSTPFTKILIE